MRGIATGILFISTAYLVYSIISHPLEGQNIIFAPAVAIGFIALGANNKVNKHKEKGVALELRPFRCS